MLILYFFGGKNKSSCGESLKLINGEKQILTTKDLKTGHLQPSSQLGLGLSNNKNVAPQGSEFPKMFTVSSIEPRKKKKPYYFPLYWMVNRAPYHGLL